MIRRLAAAALVLAGAAACRTPGDGATGVAKEQTLVVTGSSTIAPLLVEIGKRWEQEHPGRRVDVQAGGSGRGIADTRQGLADLGMSSRPLTPEEIATGLLAFPIAKDGVGFVVHATNPLGGLTREEVIGIYTGRITRWTALGGSDAPITVVSKAEGRATLELFLQWTGLRSPEIRASVLIGDNLQGIKTVAGNPHAIGYVSIGTAEHEAARGTPVKLVSVDGVAASTETVAGGIFPIMRELYLITRGEPRGAARDLIDYSRSAKVNDLVRGQFFVPIAVPGS